FNHAVYYFSHFRNAVYTLDIAGVEQPFLANHFSLITIFYSPLYYVFGSYTLLVIQIAAILFGGFFIYKYSLLQFEKATALPALFVVHFFSIWGIYSALSYDFHNNVLGAMLVPAFVYFVEKRKIAWSLVFTFLILFTKEVSSIWLVFIVLGLSVKNRRNIRQTFYKMELPILLISIIYGIVVIFWLMPKLQGSSQNLQFQRYQYFGNSLSDMVVNFAKNPKLIFDALFLNTTNDISYNYIKIETYIMFLLAGGVFCFYNPAFLVMLISIFAQKFLTNDYALWGINGQYSIEFVPIISLATIDFVRKIKTSKNRKIIAITIVLLTVVSNIKTIDSRQSKWYDAANTNFYNSAHYTTDLNIDEINTAMSLIDKDASVSATSLLVPRLAFRDKIYHFPITKNADYIVLLKDRNYYPMNEASFKISLQNIRKNKQYFVLFEGADIVVFSRVKKLCFFGKSY
ncbi:MAG: hypothetical protein CSB06_00190, partial [Bacteroidia bacterium]